MEKEDRIQRAVELFMKGYGCCQSVFCAFAERYGMDVETALKVSAGFGGGVGRLRMMCGTCSALVMLAGLEKGQTRGEDREGKADCYRLVRQLLDAFKQRNGSIICAELLQMKAQPPSDSPQGGRNDSPQEMMSLNSNAAETSSPPLGGVSGGLWTEPCMPDERTAEYYRVRPCARKVESAARVFAEYLAGCETSQKEGKA